MWQKLMKLLGLHEEQRFITVKTTNKEISLPSTYDVCGVNIYDVRQLLKILIPSPPEDVNIQYRAFRTMPRYTLKRTKGNGWANWCIGEKTIHRPGEKIDLINGDTIEVHMYKW